MGKKPAPQREYHFSDATLIQITDDKIIFANRDVLDLTADGVTTVRIAALQVQRDDFADFPDDEELQEPVNTATADQNAKAEIVKQHIRNVRRMAENTWGTKDARYRGFAFDGLNDLSENQLYRAMKRVIRRATFHQAALAAEGLTPTKITDMTTANDNYDDALDVQHDAVADRDIQQQVRVDKGNALYAEVVKICNTGKDYYQDKNEAKYNDYIIYNTPDALPPGP